MCTIIAYIDLSNRGLKVTNNYQESRREAGDIRNRHGGGVDRLN